MTAPYREGAPFPPAPARIIAGASAPKTRVGAEFQLANDLEEIRRLLRRLELLLFTAVFILTGALTGAAIALVVRFG